MKNLLFLLFPIYLFSQEKCFDDGEKHYSSGGGLLFLKDTEESILLTHPKYIQIKEDKTNLSYEEDEMSEYKNTSESWEEQKVKYEKKYAEFKKHFNNQFWYIQIQKEKNSSYAIAKNSFGYWLLEIKNKKAGAYYIGFNKNTYINRNQKETFVRDNKLFINGSFIAIAGSWARPGHPEIEAVKDYLTFEISLNEIKRDSDGDGYNDFFENLISLNPNSKDTDGDGISDFTDLNPLHKSENNKFTNLFEEIIEKDSWSFNNPKNNYTFETYESDCEYFQKINPKNKRVLILSDNQTYKLKSDYKQGLFSTFYGRIKKGSTENFFYIPYFHSMDGGKIIAVYENGKWSIQEDQEFKI